MRDHDGNIVVYIGQPWCHPEGILVGVKYDGLVIQTSQTKQACVDKKGFAIAHITYEEFKKWRENSPGTPKQEKKQINRFEIMDFEE